MQKPTEVTLDAKHEAFIAEQIAEGNFTSASDAINAALDLLERREAKIQAVRDALIEAEESGVAENFNIDTLLDDMKRKYAEKPPMIWKE